MPTAYLSPSLLRELTDVSVSNPGAGEAGQLLTWNGSAFVLRTSAESRTDLGLGTLATQNANAVAITGGAISGITPLPIASGGTGSNNGSITGTGALTFAAGGTNQNIALNPSGGFGAVDIKNNLKITLGTNGRDGVNLLTAGPAFATLGNGSSGNSFIPFFWAEGNVPGILSLGFQAQQVGQTNNTYGVISFFATSQGGQGSIQAENNAFGFFNGPGNVSLLMIEGSGNCRFHSTTESTSTTTGAVRIDGGLGVAKNVNVGGNLRFSGGTVPATATSAGTTGDIRYDGDHLYICTATNTWRRTALSTW